MQTLKTASARERICLSCRDKTCCSYYTVTLTAGDVMRIARAMRLAPEEFVTCVAMPEGEEGGFLLNSEGPRFCCVLARRSLAGAETSPCIFLLRLNDGHSLCGLGDLRPAQCRMFPAYLADGFVAIAHFPGGCSRTWSYGDLDLEEERRELSRCKAEEAMHGALVAEWNQAVRSGGRERSFEEFCAFFVNRLQDREEAP